jgi:hypothetical protein
MDSTSGGGGGGGGGSDVCSSATDGTTSADGAFVVGALIGGGNFLGGTLDRVGGVSGDGSVAGADGTCNACLDFRSCAAPELRTVDASCDELCWEPCVKPEGAAAETPRRRLEGGASRDVKWPLSPEGPRCDRRR